MASKKKIVYRKKDPISHILARPDMYVGSKRARTYSEYTADSMLKIKMSDIEVSPAFVRIFVEALSNAIDNWSRSKDTDTPSKMIKIDINMETGEFSIWNDGCVIAIEKHQDEGCYNHTMIFGQLLTGSNYDDEEERVDISGRNGFGVKLCNVLSGKFEVDGVDPVNKKRLTQTWTNNMRSTKGPNVTSSSLKKGYTKVTWTPDFEWFEMKSISNVKIIDLFRKLAIDTSMLTGISVHFNNEKIPVKTLLAYAKLYSTDEAIERNEFLTFKHEYKAPETGKARYKNQSCQVLIAPSDTEFEFISFSNGIYNPLGGVHVDAWTEAIFRPLVVKFNKKGRPVLNIADIRRCFKIFVVLSIPNPEYDGQDKRKLEAPKVAAEMKTSHIAKIAKWSIASRIEDAISRKELVVLQDIERKKKGYIKVEGLDPANNQGGKLGYKCGVIFVEGLAAKTYAVKGIENGIQDNEIRDDDDNEERVGRDWFGVYALRGKLLNVRNSKTPAIAKNKVIFDIFKILNLRYDVDYTVDANFKTLFYGYILILTDADVDGIHIEALLINMIHALAPSLLQRKKPFIISMKTPIVRVYNKPKDLLFYNENAYNKYKSDFLKANPEKKIKKMYYKGLGTSTDKDITETFGKKLVAYYPDDKTDACMNKVFLKSCTDARKNWLKGYDPNIDGIRWNKDSNVMKMFISHFIDTEMIKFSIDDCGRSLPGMMDGLKEGGRKVMFSVFKRKLTFTGKLLKVAQLAGYVAEHSCYHHGEQNLYDSITRQANNYPGSNNLPLLFRGGQFGTMAEGGKDAANARYIFTKQDALTRFLIRLEDEGLLNYKSDDGQSIEPDYYAPIIPLILANGISVGIGTGWSSNVPSYNPLDLVSSVKIWLDNDGEVCDLDGEPSLLPEIIPWYRGFNGTITPDEKSQGVYKTSGVLETMTGKNKDIKVVTSLPIGLWTDKFKNNLDDWRSKGDIKSYKNYSTPTKARFEITEHKNGFICNLNTLKLTTLVRTTNMVMFNEKNQLIKYKSPNHIIDDFCRVRYGIYVRRKKKMLDDMGHTIKFISNKVRFIEEVIQKEFELFEDYDVKGSKKTKARKLEAIVSDLETAGYDKEMKTKDNEDEDEDEDKDDVKGTGYEYLLRMRINSVTEERLEKMRKEKESLTQKRNDLLNTTEKEIWIRELDEFVTAYVPWIKEAEKADNNAKKRKKI
jgi:DNA topoisomerase-2